MKLVKLSFLLLFMVFNIALSAQNLIIGTANYAPPFETRVGKQNQFIGFDIDIMNAICKRIQKECKYVGLPFDKLFTGLSEGSIDLAIAAIVITPQRQTEFLFSLPYLEGEGQFMTLRSTKIDNIEQLKGKRVGTLKGTLYKELLLVKFARDIQLIEYDSVPRLYQSLDDSQTDAIVDAEPTVNFWISNNSQHFKTVGDPFSIGPGLGIMANLSSGPLINNINTALQQMRSDGSYLNIYNLYFSEVVMP